MSTLLSVDEVRHYILSQLSPLPVETISLEQAFRRVLATPILAPSDLPPFTNSSVDGFAVRALDVKGASQLHPIELKVFADIPAGFSPHFTLPPGHAARIMTGAPLPNGADAVVPIENTNLSFHDKATQPPYSVQVFNPVNPGDNVRPRGQDILRGHPVFEPGHRLRPQDIGLLAALGISHIEVYRQPRLGIFSTGDELIPLGTAPIPGKIYDSNRLMLKMLIEQAGGEVIDLGIVTDTLDNVRSALDTARRNNVDLVLTSGGVSVGVFDVVRHLIEQEGERHLWRVNMRPGKPILFGRYHEMPILSLPGNPVSAFVGFWVFVRPAIYRLAGLPFVPPLRLKAILEHPIESDGRESYLRAIVSYTNGQRLARLTGHQGSGNLFGLSQANALLIVPAGVKSLPTGHEVDIWPLDDSLI
ncbi:molybdopterin molybdotransferase MoeA [Thermanaerothrix sp. 4228-RoL]|uniref:Molybdopterin molybdenumtransferase n=2 Tax=Thermanaerothrix TaxID=1077886 RepID=A0ABU3NIT4_9CHLR|nr:gephyrin-like molybdotransferase Glp [Thermanaerothrix sp. 4228-RoL]MDT8896759.1 molybdopterin molybdotransferase MoeA [Thermanaerothrix sp. 4228-RoL]